MTEIYYIEDDKSIAQSVKEYLEQYDFRVTVYGTITDARTAIVKMRPQLILLDWNMPDGQGDRMCRFIRSQWSKLPIIFLRLGCTAMTSHWTEKRSPCILAKKN